MDRQTVIVHRITDAVFQEALAQLHEGRIPSNFSDVVAHIHGTVKELMDYANAVTECALRLNNSNEVLRDILAKANVRYENTPDGPRKIIRRDGAND